MAGVIFTENEMVSIEGFLNTDMNYPGIEISVELIVIQEYLSKMELGIKTVCDTYIKNEELKHGDSEYFEYRHIYNIAEDDLPRIIRMPFVVTIYTLFENSINQLLNYAQEKENKSLKLKDLNAKSLTSKYNKYMTHVLNYEFQLSAQIMADISSLNKVRNCIAHTNGNLESMSEERVQAIKEVRLKNIGVSVNNNQLDVPPEYLIASMEVVTIGINNLMEYMEQRYGFE